MTAREEIPRAGQTDRQRGTASTARLRPGAERLGQGCPGQAGTTVKPARPRGRYPVGCRSPPPRAKNCHGSRCRRSGPEGDLYSKRCTLTSPKAFNGGHYSHPENRCILIPSELLVWLCFCFSSVRAAFNKAREPCKRDHTLHFPLKLLEVHFPSRAVFLESMHINQNQ